MNIAEINKYEVPSGIVKPQPRQSLENVELRATLDRAVEQAKLNVTERLALNEKFYPNGGGFPLFGKDETCPVFNFFISKKHLKADDIFIKQAEAIKLPETVSVHRVHVMRSSKGCLQANFDNAIKKLSQVLKKGF